MAALSDTLGVSLTQFIESIPCSFPEAGGGKSGAGQEGRRGGLGFTTSSLGAVAIRRTSGGHLED